MVQNFPISATAKNTKFATPMVHCGDFDFQNVAPRHDGIGNRAVGIIVDVHHSGALFTRPFLSVFCAGTGDTVLLKVFKSKEIIQCIAISIFLDLTQPEPSLTKSLCDRLHSKYY